MYCTEVVSGGGEGIGRQRDAKKEGEKNRRPKWSFLREKNPPKVKCVSCCDGPISSPFQTLSFTFAHLWKEGVHGAKKWGGK